MPQRSTTVRFDEDLWELLAQESAAGGVSTASTVTVSLDEGAGAT